MGDRATPADFERRREWQPSESQRESLFEPDLRCQASTNLILAVLEQSYHAALLSAEEQMTTPLSQDRKESVRATATKINMRSRQFASDSSALLA